MTDTPPEARFAHALAAGVLRTDSGGDPPEAAAHAALREALAGQKSLVLEVQFTGFTRRGEPVAGVDPALLRAAAHLIILRVTRLGFTAEAEPSDIAELLAVLSRAPADLPPEGVVALLQERAPRGVYVGTSTGETYRPPAAEPEPAPPAPAAPEMPDVPRTPTVTEEEDAVAVSEFELLHTAPETPAAPAPGGGEGRRTPPPPPEREEPPSDDLYHFFRAAPSGPRREEDTERLAEELRTAVSPNRFDELTHSVVAAVPRLLDAGADERTIQLLDRLVEEAQRPDRTRIFRDSAVQALRRVGTEHVLARLAELLAAGAVRERLLRIFLFLGGDALSVLEGTVFRTQDPELREAVFRALLEVDPLNERLLARAMEDPVVARARSVLELAALPGVDPALALRWAERAATHADATVRMDGVRAAARIGDRGGVRVLVELLGDPDRIVRRAAIEALGRLGDPGAVPFLARVLADSGEEELQLAAIAALGKTASAEALPALTGVLNRRQLFAGSRLKRLKTAAVAALGRIPAPGARELLQGLASGRDAELAAEAKRALSQGG